VNSQSSMSDQAADVSQMSEPGRLTLLQSADVSQESTQSLFIKSVTDSMMKSKVISKLESELESKLDQRITNPIEGIAEAASNGLWMMMLALMSPVLVPIIIVGVALAFIMVSWLRSSPSAGPTNAGDIASKLASIGMAAMMQQGPQYVQGPQPPSYDESMAARVAATATDNEEEELEETEEKSGGKANIEF
jgi:hypothetical protein